jgi:hypothetical protein
MKNLSLTTLVVLCLLSFNSRATVIYVDSAHISGIQTGTSWFTAFSDFQEGINTANAGDTVWVAKGTYRPAYDSSFSMKEGVKILGGFLNNHSDVTQRDPSINPTILKGNNSNVVMNQNLTNAALIDGFIITNGKAVNGAGMRNAEAAPIVSNCLFTKNIGDGGAGIFNELSAGTYIVNCVFDSNYSTISANSFYVAFGLGIANRDSRVEILNCTFTRNTALRGSGAGIESTASQVLIKGCYFSENNIGTESMGGAILSQSGSSIIDSCMFFNNHGGWFGGAIAIHYDTNSTVRNCIINSNTALSGGGLAIIFSKSITIEQNVFQDNITVSQAMMSGGGGAIYNQSDSSYIHSCSFLGNSSAYGGAFVNGECNGSVFANCLFAGNVADSAGGVAYNTFFWHNSPINYRVVNCSFIKNKSLSASAESFYNDSLTTIGIDNSIIWGNSGGIINHDATATYAATHSLIQQEPANAQFHNLDGAIDPLLVDTAAGDYRLRFNSPCINRGNDAAVPGGIITDLIHNPRISYDTVDIGAYEYAFKVKLIDDTTFCNGNELTISAGNPGASYLWSTGDTTQSITVSQSGAYTVMVSNTFGSISDTVAVTVAPLPVVNLGSDTTIVAGTQLVLNAGNAGSQYLWNTGATTQTISVAGSGIYDVKVTSSAGCSASDTILVSVTLATEEIPTRSLAYISLSPNPAAHELTLIIDNPALIKRKVTISDITGHKAQEFTATSRITTIQLNGHAPGLYLLQVDGAPAVKFVKE